MIAGTKQLFYIAHNVDSILQCSTKVFTFRRLGVDVDTVGQAVGGGASLGLLGDHVAHASARAKRYREEGVRFCTPREVATHKALS